MLTLLLELLLIQGTNGKDTKIWTMDTNFENPRNWPEGNIPCANDRIIFPEHANLVMFLPKDFTFSEMILPIDGEFLLKDGSYLWLTNKGKDKSCQGTDVQFIANTDYWYDPNNWNITSKRLYPNPNIPRKSLAVPHALNIPCKSDHVVFPKDSAFKVHISNAIEIGSLTINEMEYNNDEFQTLIHSRIGKLLFSNLPRVTISGSNCNSVSGCICSSDDPQDMTKICKYVTCPKVECSDPIKPSGHCCLICAAFLEMEYERNFDIDKLSDFTKAFLTKPNFKEVESFTFKTYKDTIQSVFVDSAERKGAAAEIAKLIHEKILEDLEGSNINKLRSVKIHFSQNWAANIPTEYFSGNQGISGGGIFGIVFVILCLLGLAAAWYIYKKRQIPGFNFARFDLHSNKIELELGTTPHEELDPERSSVESFPPPKDDETPSVSKSFDNPIYDVVSENYEAKASTKTNTDGAETLVENPIFMISEEPKK